MPTVFGLELLCYTVEVGAESRAECFLPQHRLLPQVLPGVFAFDPSAKKENTSVAKAAGGRETAHSESMNSGRSTASTNEPAG
jgi:hypothetical protein